MLQIIVFTLGWISRLSLTRSTFTRAHFAVLSLNYRAFIVHLFRLNYKTLCNHINPMRVLFLRTKHSVLTEPKRTRLRDLVQFLKYSSVHIFSEVVSRKQPEDLCSRAHFCLALCHTESVTRSHRGADNIGANFCAKAWPSILTTTQLTNPPPPFPARNDRLRFACHGVDMAVRYGTAEARCCRWR